MKGQNRRGWNNFPEEDGRGLAGSQHGSRRFVGFIDQIRRQTSEYPFLPVGKFDADETDHNAAYGEGRPSLLPIARLSAIETYVDLTL